MTTTFVKATTRIVAPPDPYKYVNYTQGMLLGVDDFIQEHTYLSEHANWLTRELLGYGTLSGLQISTDVDSDNGPRILVRPGIAINAHGQLIRVPSPQCAHLNAWFAANKQQLPALSAGPISVFVVLDYSETASDNVPVAGEVGRYAETLMIPSRLSDDFTLDLRLTAPQQPEEEAVRRFVSWLRQVPVSTNQDEKRYSELSSFLEALRKAAASADPNTPTTFLSQAPADNLLIPATKASEYWRKAFFLWTSELRPLWQKNGNHNSSEESPLLLAKLHMHIQQAKNGNWEVVIPENAHPVRIHEDERPYMLHTRLLQEWLLAGQRETTPVDIQVNEVNEINEVFINEKIEMKLKEKWGPKGHAPTLTGDVTGENAITVQGLQNIPVAPDIPGEGQILTFTGEKWQPADPPASTNSVEYLPELDAYTILAAGHIKCDGSSTQPTYNELTAHAHADGQVALRFKGYTRPKQTPYILNILPVWSPKIHMYSVFLERFEDEYILLHVVNLHGDVIRLGELRQLEFIVEIKQYSIAPPITESTPGRKRKR